MISPFLIYADISDNFNNIDLKRLKLFKGNLEIGEQVKLNTFFDLTFFLTPIKNFDSVKVIFYLPEGLVGKTKKNLLEFKKVHIDSSNIYIFKTRVKAINEGYKEFLIYVEGKFDNKYLYKQIFSYKLLIGQNYIVIQKKIKPSTIENLTPEEIKKIRKQKSFKDTSSTTGIRKKNDLTTYFTISGRFRYDDIDDGGKRKPIRYATVKLMEDISYLPDKELAVSYTNYDGYFNFNINFNGTKKLYIRIECETAAVKVVPGAFLGPYYSETAHKDVSSNDPSTWDFGWYYFSATNANWAAFDDIIDEYQWVNNKTGWKRSKIEVRWPVGDWPQHSTNYLGQDWIELPDRSVESWTRTTILHEYAHAIMYKLYNNNMPSGWGPDPHYIFSESSPGFAIKEGWAEFMQSAIDNDPFNVVDIGGNIETNNWQQIEDSYNWDGNKIEGSVASVLWDIFDSRPGDDDPLSLGFNNSWGSIWRTMSKKPNSIDEFWTYWFQSYNYAQSMWSIFYNYGINKDKTPPTGSISINNGASTTNSLIVTLNLSATDNLSGMGTGAQMRFSNNNSSWSSPEAYKTVKYNWDLSSYGGNSNPGNKVVYVQFKDAAGNWSTSYADHIYYIYLNPPTNVAASDGSYTDKVVVTWSSVSSASYYRVYRNTTNNPSTASPQGGWRSTTYYYDTYATPGVTYYYWVTAATSSTGANESAFSSYNTGWRALSAPSVIAASDGTYFDK